MDIEYPLSVLYRLDSIQYNIVYTDNSYKLDQERIPETTNNNLTIDYTNGSQYIVFIQNKNQRRLVCSFYAMGDGTDRVSFIKKVKTDGYEDFFGLGQEQSQSRPVLLLKNVRRELAFLQEYRPNIYQKLLQYKLYCLDTYLKYKLNLPLYVQGKLSRRYRIPTIEEFLEEKQIKPLSPQKSEWAKYRLFLGFVIDNIVETIEPYHNIQRLDTIQLDRLMSFIDYILLQGYERNHIVIISGQKRRIPKIDGVEILSLEQYYKYFTNYKRDYRVFILDGIPDTFKNIEPVYLLV